MASNSIEKKLHFVDAPFFSKIIVKPQSAVAREQHVTFLIVQSVRAYPKKIHRMGNLSEREFQELEGKKVLAHTRARVALLCKRHQKQNRGPCGE